MRKENKLTEVAVVFFRLGLIAFGGPAAHIAMMEDEIVRRRKWISREHFLDLVGATNLIPGPNSTEMAMHCGHERAGPPGLFVAGICFIVPAVAITGVLAWLYVRYGNLPHIVPFIYGIRPAVIVVIGVAIYRLGAKAVRNTTTALIGILVAVAALLGVNEVIAILAAGLLGMTRQAISKMTDRASALTPLLLSAMLVPPGSAVSNTNLFLVFLKIGAVLFGSGYVLVGFLNGELVEARGWISYKALVEAIAVGQFTPGPVLSTATFVGYIINGSGGALAATIGIFLPSFVFVWLLNPLVPRLRKSAVASAFLESVNVAAVGIMLAVAVQLGVQVMNDWRASVIAICSALAMLIFRRVNPAWTVLGGALLGWLLWHL